MEGEEEVAAGVLFLDPVGLLLVPAAAHSGGGSSSSKMDIPSKLWRYMALSDVWGSYERGHATDVDAVIWELADLPLVRAWSTTSSGSHHNHNVNEVDVELRGSIRRAMERERKGLCVVPEMVEQLQLLRSGRHPEPGRLLGGGCWEEEEEEKAEAGGRQSFQLKMKKYNWRIVGVSNMAREEVCELRLRFPEVFSILDDMVVSGEEGVRLPSMAILRRAMERIIRMGGIDIMSGHGTSYNNIKKKKKKKKNWINNVRSCYFAHATCMQSVMAAASLGIRPAIPLLLHRHHLINLNLNLLQRAPPLPPSIIIGRRRRRSPQILPPKTSSSYSASNAIASARTFLLTRYPASFQFPSVTAFGVSFYDNFARFLIADLLCDSRFLPMQEAPLSGLLFFLEKTAPIVNHPKHSSKHVHVSTFDSSFILETLPEDLDTTSIGLSILHKFGKVSMNIINGVLDKMLAEHVCDMDGILQVYFDVHRPRVDPIVITNIIYVFHLANRGHEVEKSEMFVQNVLFHKAYVGGTLYYELGEAFLLHVSRLVHAFQDHFTRTGMRALLVKRLQEHRIQTKMAMDRCNCLALAMYMRSCILCGLGITELDQQRLVQLQKEDGSWCCHPYYIYGSNRKGWIGNDGLTTSYALSVLENAFT